MGGGACQSISARQIFLFGAINVIVPHTVILPLVNQLAHLAIYGQLGTKLAGRFT